MSFDVYFFEPSAADDWEAALEALEEVGEDLLSEADLEQWSSIVAAVEPVLPETVSYESETVRQLTVEAIGLQLTLSPGELSLTVPYWSTGDEAERTVRLLRDVASAVEGATGLIAYDPQSDGPFLAGSTEAAGQSFERAATVLDDVRAGRATAEPPPKRRWFGRR